MTPKSIICSVAPAENLHNRCRVISLSAGANVLASPPTAGVTASFAMLVDFIFGEPKTSVLTVQNLPEPPHHAKGQTVCR